MAKTISLVGVVHRDPTGGEKLAALLDELSPDVVVLDASEVSVSFRKEHAARLLDLLDQRLERLICKLGRDVSGHGEFEAIRAMIRMPYEIEASFRDGKRRVLFAGDPNVSRSLLADLETDLLSEPNLALLASMSDVPLSDKARLEYRRARLRLEEDSEADPQLEEADDRIARLAESIPAGRVAVVCGWEHLPGLRKRLGARAFLPDEYAELSRPIRTEEEAPAPGRSSEAGE